ncbi:peroxisome assembly protein 12-like [Mercenaria mercenaria]|uniref:peroxisome assembly protein 12-like n=1 Tax=Mercenaria mercenaria TaxID=6596 RepID=UPI00234EB81D|nr:peroxisome assembly protein 12-like [Mercenaria mercenaria]
MAEGAHLTSAVGHGRPSIFEVLAQESLISTVRPAVKHAVRVAAENRPEKFGWLLRYYDEVYTTLDFLLEQYYLRKYCATFAENFYSLKRVSPSQKSSRLPRGVIWKSLLCVVILPYVKQKLDEKFENLRHLYNTYAGNQEMSKLSRTFVAVYPYVHTIWEGAILSYQTAYMFGKCDWHSPFLQLTGVTLCNDLEDGEEGQRSRSLPWQQLSLQGKMMFIMKKMLNFTAVSVSTGLSVGLFFIQFLDWWYSSETSHKSLTSLPVPDPPQRDDTTEAAQFNVCPICHRTRSNDTALSVSGYVFCYPCIYDYVKEYKKCPVTRFPAQTEHLIKLYITGS